jgi:hypothetical protein
MRIVVKIGADSLSRQTGGIRQFFAGTSTGGIFAR